MTTTGERKNHLAGQAMRDGIVMSGKRLDYTYNYDDEYPQELA